MFPSLNALNLRFEDAGNPFQYSLFASACTDFVPNFPQKNRQTQYKICR